MMGRGPVGTISQGHACNKSSSIMLNTHAGQSTKVAYPR